MPDCLCFLLAFLQLGELVFCFVPALFTAISGKASRVGRVLVSPKFSNYGGLASNPIKYESSKGKRLRNPLCSGVLRADAVHGFEFDSITKVKSNAFTNSDKILQA